MNGLHRRIAERLVGNPGGNAVAVLDVDLTLIENAPRTRALLADFCRLHVPGDAALIERAASLGLVFSIQRNAIALGLPEHLIPAVFPFWRTAFFDPGYLKYDHALDGAAAAVNALRAADISVVYLTARPSSLAAATVASLAELGFPIGVVGTTLVTKDDPAESDHDYKARALGWIGRLGRTILVADNEPLHVNAMHAAFPDALAVHVNTRHSSPAPPLAAAVEVHARLADAVLAPAVGQA